MLSSQSRTTVLSRKLNSERTASRRCQQKTPSYDSLRSVDRRRCIRALRALVYADAYFNTASSIHMQIGVVRLSSHEERTKMIVYKELSSLETDLGIPAKTLYAVSNSLSRHYRTVAIPKRDGTERLLSVPDPLLKHIQQQIANVLLRLEPVSPHATAYRPGSSIVGNAQPHTEKKLLLKLDILHFFDSVLYSDVKRRAFPESRYSEQNRILLTMLCYYRDSLPQGAPTSPAISNIILYPFDCAVGEWCRERRIDYTRYSDDMTFSGSFDPAEVTAFVGNELRRYGFFLNHKKTVTADRAQRQLVTGIVVNKEPHTAREYRRAVRQEIYYCRKFGVEAHLRQTGQSLSPAAYLQKLYGRARYILFVDPSDRSAQQACETVAGWLRAARQT